MQKWCLVHLQFRIACLLCNSGFMGSANHLTHRKQCFTHLLLRCNKPMIENKAASLILNYMNIHVWANNNFVQETGEHHISLLELKSSYEPLIIKRGSGKLLTSKVKNDLGKVDVCSHSCTKEHRPKRTTQKIFFAHIHVHWLSFKLVL